MRDIAKEKSFIVRFFSNICKPQRFDETMLDPLYPGYLRYEKIHSKSYFPLRHA